MEDSYGMQSVVGRGRVHELFGLVVVGPPRCDLCRALEHVVEVVVLQEQVSLLIVQLHGELQVLTGPVDAD